MQGAKAPLMSHLQAVAVGGAGWFTPAPCLSWPALLAWKDELCSHGSFFLSCRDPICVRMGCRAYTHSGVSSRTGSYWQVQKQNFKFFF